MRISACAGPGGNPDNTRYQIQAIVNGGSGYSAGDVLTFPDVQGKNIGSAPSTGNGELVFKL